MYRFWDIIIEPILELLQPKNIVEIGADQGNNTKNLLEFCMGWDVKLISIDPLPKFDVSAWQKHYGDHFIFYKSLSLNAIPLINQFDVVLIDGDHNWYTVYNELKLIEKRCQGFRQPFPLTMLHDVGWPYGRRDLYYNPENIPDVYRKPHAKKGIRPGSPKLVDNGGLNPHLLNSICENNFQSGVLTAVEDFIRETEQHLEFIHIPGHNGLGILMPVQLKECNQKLAEFVNAFISPVVMKHVEKIEVSRVDLEIKKLEQQATLRAKEVEVSDLRKQLSELERALAEIRVQHTEVKSVLDREQMTWQEERQCLEAEIEEQREEARHFREDLEQQMAALRAKEARQAQDIEKLAGWVEQMMAGVSLLLSTHRWKVGNALGELQRKILFKRRQPIVTDSIDYICQDFQRWKQAQKEQLKEVNLTGSVATIKTSGLDATSDDVMKLRHWLEQLEHGMNMLLLTRRWNIGNSIGFVSLAFRGVAKPRMAFDNISEIFLQYRNWSPRPGNENIDTQKLACWIEQLQYDYAALLNCRRWIIGDRIVTFANRLILRKKNPMVTDYIETIFSSFNGLQEIRRNTAAVEMGIVKTAKIRPRLGKKIDYAEWITRNDTLSNDDIVLIRKHIASLQSRPKFSILMPVCNTKPPYLQEAIDSIIGQLYEDWELCVVVEASTSAEIHRILEVHAHKNDRIRLRFSQTNGGISACNNTALEMASGDWIVLMNCDDVLSEHALYLIAEAINDHPDAVTMYSDEDHIDKKSRRFDPYFKPDWDYDLFLGQNLISHLGVYRADLARRVGGFHEGLEESQDWDFALRVIESMQKAEIHHIPFILYHSRQENNTTSSAHGLEIAQQVVNEHFKRTGQAARAIPAGYSSCLRIKRDLPVKRPLVSIIIPTKDHCKLLQTCIDGLLNRTDYKPVEIVIVDNGSSEPDAVAFLAGLQSHKYIKVIKDTGAFNFSRLVNLGVAASHGEVCVLLNNDTNVINSDWLDEMVSHALRPEVGAVGAKLYYANDKIQHGGVILGIYNVAGIVADHAHRLAPRQSPGYFGRLNLTHSLSCVTAACLATRREIYDHIGGFDEQHLAVSFNDVDFCLQVRQAGYKIIFTPNAELYHYEKISRGDPNATPEKSARNRAERSYMRERWASVLDNDPYYNPNLSLDTPTFDLSAMPRVRRPWLEFAMTKKKKIDQRKADVKIQNLSSRDGQSIFGIEKDFTDSFCDISETTNSALIDCIELFFIKVDICRNFSTGSWPARYQCMIKVVSGQHAGWSELTLTRLSTAVADTERVCSKWLKLSVAEGLKLCIAEIGKIPDMYLESMELALIDLSARLAQKNAIELLGLQKALAPIPGLECILQKDPAIAVEQAKVLARTHLKIKLFGDIGLDEEIVRRVREILPEKCYFTADVNEGYLRNISKLTMTDINTLVAYMKRLYIAGLNACEDPAKLTFEEMEMVQGKIPEMPIIIDKLLRPAYKLYNTLKVVPGHIYNLHPHCMGSVRAMLLLSKRLSNGGAKIMVGDNSLIGAGCTAWQQLACNIGAEWCEAIEKPLEYSHLFTNCIKSCATKRDDIGLCHCEYGRIGFGLDIDSEQLARNAEFYRMLEVDRGVY